MKTFYAAFIVVVLIITSACERPFSFSPFEATVPGEIQNTTQKNLDLISSLEALTKDTFKIAVISDVHYHFNDAGAALKKINATDDVAFVIVTGDFTENGLVKEFEIFHSLMAESSKPYLTVIGNHDYLSNGGVIYQKVFGPLNYTFVFKSIKFVMWDNVLWESNKQPDWTWFRNEIEKSNEENNSFGRIIPFSHIPPFDGQLVDSAAVFHELLVRNKIQLSIHGHKHEFSLERLFGGDIKYVTIGSPDKRAYVELTVSPAKIRVDKIEY